MRRSPLLLPVVALVAGAELALRSLVSRPLLAVGLLAFGLALRGKAGPVVCGLAAGMIAAWAQPAPALNRFDLRRPLTVEATFTSPWQRSGNGWISAVRVRRLVQGGTAQLDRSRLWLGVGGSERPPGGRRVRARGRIGFPPPAANGTRALEPSPRMWVKSRRLLEVRGEPPVWRSRVRAAWSRALGSAETSGNGVGLARALVLGDRSGLGRRFEQGLRRAGLGHLLAISGLHVGILTAAGLLIGRLLGGRSGRRWSWLPPMLCAAAYLLIVGARPAVVRAALMAAIAWVALALGGRTTRWNTLALALGAMVAGAPWLVRDLGFRLTAAATCGILFAAEPRDGPRNRAIHALRVSVSAQAFTLPWALPVFHLLAPFAPIHNLWAVPWTALVLFAAFGWTLVALADPDVAGRSSGVLELAALPFELLGRLPAGPWWSTPVRLSPLAVALLSVAAAALLRRPIVAALLLNGVALAVATGTDSAERPQLAMLDVGQGEALLLRDRGATALVDGGGWRSGDVGSRVLVPALASLGVRRLDALVLTHPDLDHCRGLVDVAALVRAREVWTSAGWAGSPCALDLLSLPGVRWRPLWAGMRRAIGDWRIDVLHPAPGEREAVNDRSLVLRAETRGFRALLTGDVERRGEQALLANRPAEDLRVDLLKVSHHGSRTSSRPALLAAAAPRLAWISAGPGNRDGHPAREVLERLAAAGARVLRTDRDGMVVLEIDPTGRIHLARPGAPRWSPPLAGAGAR